VEALEAESALTVFDANGNPLGLFVDSTGPDSEYPPGEGFQTYLVEHEVSVFYLSHILVNRLPVGVDTYEISFSEPGCNGQAVLTNAAFFQSSRLYQIELPGPNNYGYFLPRKEPVALHEVRSRIRRVLSGECELIDPPTEVLGFRVDETSLEELGLTAPPQPLYIAPASH
jgi:hypothetical protein